MIVVVESITSSSLGNFLEFLRDADASSPENYVSFSEVVSSSSIVGVSNISSLNVLENRNGQSIVPLGNLGLSVSRIQTFFDTLLEDLPAVPTFYDGEYSFSSVAGAYHIVAGVMTDGQDDYSFFCAKRSHTYFVRIRPPMTIKEAIQITSRYANFWVSNPPGSPLVESEVPDEYCKYGFVLSSGEGGMSKFLDFSYQVFKDWVSFSGRTSEPSRVEVIIKRLETLEVVKTLSTETSGSTNSFYLATSLAPGDYTYEACSYPL